MLQGLTSRDMPGVDEFNGTSSELPILAGNGDNGWSVGGGCDVD